MANTKRQQLQRRKNRIRSKISGTAERPRMCVNISNRHINVQLIDDQTGKTLVNAHTLNKDSKGTMTEKAEKIGKEVAKKAKKAKITSVVLDRNGKKYHGRLKALADAAREGGLEF